MKRLRYAVSILFRLNADDSVRGRSAVGIRTPDKMMNHERQTPALNLQVNHHESVREDTDSSFGGKIVQTHLETGIMDSEPGGICQIVAPIRDALAPEPAHRAHRRTLTTRPNGKRYGTAHRPHGLYGYFPLHFGFSSPPCLRDITQSGFISRVQPSFGKLRMLDHFGNRRQGIQMCIALIPRPHQHKYCPYLRCQI